MESLTKNKQKEETIHEMVRKFFGSNELKSYKELTEGYFNLAYEITLRDGEAIILKIAPSPKVTVMTYEKNIMYSEVEAMKMAAKHADIPVPKMLGYDDSCTISSSPYFFMEKLKGHSLNSVKDTLSQEEIQRIYIEAGKINQRINEIVCPCFGYPGQPEFQGDNWYDVFCGMLKGGIADAKRGKVDLKIPVDGIWEYIEKDKSIFDEVTVPKLVHWDCWDGNIFVEDGRITGFIDWERSLWADPLMEVGFRTYSDNTDFLKGYGMELSSSQKRRSLWYDIYLMILVALECEYRKYDTMDIYNWSTDVLTKQYALLKTMHNM